jgi:hypothetical protein
MSAAPSRPDHARELRYELVDAAFVCERLGLMGGRNTFTRQAGGVIVRCPWHEDRTPSCSVRRGPDGTIAVRCHGCGATGDVLSLVAIVNGLSTRTDFRQVMLAAAELGGLHGLASELRTGIEQPERPKAVAPPAAPAPRDYPAPGEVSLVWDAAGALSADAEAAAWATSRGLDADRIDAAGLARVIAADARLPRWAAYQGAPWTATGHRLVVPMRDASGVIRSVRAGRIVDGDTPKRLPPGGHKATGLVMACEIGTAMLLGTLAPREVCLVEGEPDFLTWATRQTASVVATIGIVSGSWNGWTTSFAERVPRGAEVWIRTDADAAGDKYKREAARTLRWRGCFVKGCA